MALTVDYIRSEILNQTYEISIHADDERLADGLTVIDLEYALLNSEIVESYPLDPRGGSCLVTGFTQLGLPVHIVCGMNPLGHLILITIYIPTLPKWRDQYTRNRF